MLTADKNDLESLVKLVVGYKGTSSHQYIERYTKNWLIQMIEETDQIQKIETIFKQFDFKGVDLIDFTRAFLNLVHHEEDETLYITIALIDLFKDICETFNLNNVVNSKDVLNYIVENFLNKNPSTHVIPTRRLPDKKKFGEDPFRIREIDTNAPIIFGSVAGGIKRLKPKIIADRTHHTSNIKTACFGEGVKKIFTLDSLGDHVSVYNLNSILDRKIYPKNLNEKGDIMILDFAWSNKQQRVGAVLKDFSISLWDASDNYEFEKKFSIANAVTDYQTQIWYLEFLDLWLTTDKSHCLNIWDIEKEVKTATISSPKIKSNIINVIPIDVLKLVAVVSLDRLVTIWDFKKRTVVVELNLSQGGVHTIVWSESYHVLITAGYENNISLWTINPNFLDISLQGRLVGHSSMVTAVQVVEKTPMIVSADDQGNIKIWDIRNLSCVQTLGLGIKSTINMLIDNYRYGKMCFVGMRVNFLEFDQSSAVANNIKSEEQVWPIHSEYNFDENEIIICTRKDIRFIDIETGRCKKIYTGLLKNEEDEIATFKLIQQNKKFILGSFRGHVNLHSYGTGDFIKPLESHNNAVVSVKVDYTNNLIATSSYDSSVFIQKETNISTELKRDIKNLHFNKEIMHMELSVYHNVLVTSTNNNILYVFDYEFGKLIGSIEIKEGREPTFLQFINGYSYLVIGDNSGEINILYFTRRDTVHISFQRVAVITLTQVVSAGKESSIKGHSGNFPTKAVIQMSRELKSEGNEDCKLYLSTNSGTVKIYDLNSLLRLGQNRLIPHANTRSNYNANRIAHEDFLLSIKNYKIANFKVDSTVKEDVNLPFQNLNEELIKKFKAHKDALTSLALVVTPVKKLLTSSLDCYIRIWTLEGELLASLNINHPLPIKWTLTPEGSGTYQKKVLYALKVIETLFKRYKTSIFIAEAKKISISRFIKLLQRPQIEDSAVVNSARGESGYGRKNKQVLTMRDEYSPKDLQFYKAKAIFKKELQGPSLKQMEISKRLIEAQKAWKDHHHQEHEQRERLEQNIAKAVDDAKEKNEFMTFLLGDSRKDLMKESHYSKTTKALAKKLENFAMKPQAPAQTKVFQSSREKRRDSFNFLSNVVTKGNLLTAPLGALYSQSTFSEMSDAAKSPGLSNPTRIGIEAPQQKKKKMSQMSESAIKLTLPSPTAKTNKGFSFGHRSQSWAKVDFFEYAQEKLSPKNSALETFSSTTNTDEPGKQQLEYQRRAKKKQFHQIMTTLNTNLKQAHLAGQYTSRKPSGLALSLNPGDTKDAFLTSPKFPTDKYNSTQGSKPLNGDPNSPKMRNYKRGRTGSLPMVEAGKKVNFALEMKDAKKWMEENWGFSMDKDSRAKFESQTNFSSRQDLTNRNKTHSKNFSGGEDSETFQSLNEVFSMEKQFFDKAIRNKKVSDNKKFASKINLLHKKTMFY